MLHRAITEDYCKNICCRAITEKLRLKSLVESEARSLCWLCGEILSAIWNRVRCCKF